jgi:hypothetical protein
LYEASNLGRIRTAEGKTTSNALYEKRVWKQRILKSKTERRKQRGNRDERVNLWKDGEEKTLLVSRLVAMTWCDGFQDGSTVNHIDGNPMNNKAENLEWISLSRNINHGFDNVLFSSQKPCTLLNFSTGEKKWYRSQVKASQGIGRSDNYISLCLKKNRRIRSVSGEYYGLV